MEISGAAYDLLATPRSDKGDKQQRTMADGKGTPKETHFIACMGRERELIRNVGNCLKQLVAIINRLSR